MWSYEKIISEDKQWSWELKNGWGWLEYLKLNWAKTEQNSKNFDNFYSKSSLKPLLDRNYLIFKYFKKEKMRENGGEDIYLSIRKTFKVMDNYHYFLNKKKILQQNLNLSLRMIQDHICSKRITIQNDLENNKISNFLDIRK